MCHICQALGTVYDRQMSETYKGMVGSTAKPPTATLILLMDIFTMPCLMCVMSSTPRNPHDWA